MPDVFVAKKKNAAPNKQTGQDLIINNAFAHTHPLHLISSFCEYPDHIKFVNQEENETILLFLRRHFITNLRWIVIGIIFALIPFLLIVLKNFGTSFIQLPPKYVLMLTATYYFILLNYFFVNFITWYFNISFVTEKRVIDIDFSGLVYKNVAATKINLVQDVSYSQTGVIRSVIDYGDVFVQTAGSLENFDFNAVPHPARVVGIIENLIGKRPLNA
jgi:hypothetical protein